MSTNIPTPVSPTPKTPNPKVAFAASMSGYDDSSPIWGKQLQEVLDWIDASVDAGSPHMAASGRGYLDEIKTITQELRKRIVKGKLIKAQK